MSLEYVNRKGDRYYILQGRTKTGKPTYYCSKRSNGLAVDRLPEGYEIHESPASAIVSLRKIRSTRIQPFERALLERLAGELCSVGVLIDVEGDGLIVYASHDREAARLLAELTDGAPGRERQQLDWIRRHSQYSPELRFTLTDEDDRLFSAERWCYLGRIDNWIFLSSSQGLERLARSYLPHLGEESFYELH